MIVLTATVVFSACKKEDNGADNVTITFTEPQENDTVASWNQVHMEGTVTGDGTMRGYTLSAINSSTGEVLYTTTYNVKAKAYNFHEHWINNLQDTTTVIVRMDVLKDVAGNYEVKERKVVCLP